MSRFLPRHIEVLITSHGGVGTSFIMHHIARYRAINAPNDKDGLKHLPIPPVSFNPGIRCVYVFGDPVMATLSLFRRRYHCAQSYKLNCLGSKVPATIPIEMSVDAYAEQGLDLLKFEAHFRNWHAKYTIYPTLFIRYEKLWENLEALVSFLGLPESAVTDFPARRPRQTEPEGVSPVTWRKLRQMYASFDHYLSGVADVVIRGEQYKRKKTHLICSRNFREALMQKWLDLRRRWQQ